MRQADSQKLAGYVDALRPIIYINNFDFHAVDELIASVSSGVDNIYEYNEAGHYVDFKTKVSQTELNLAGLLEFVDNNEPNKAFLLLKDIHLWGNKERFDETGIREAWEEDLADVNTDFVRSEIELIFRRSEVKRSEAEKKITSEIQIAGGKVLAQSCIEEINYHALLVSIPRQYAEKALQDSNVALVTLDEIMFIRPAGQIAVSGSSEAFDYDKAQIVPDTISDEPILALFDGLPQEHHPLLENLLIIDDPDDYTSSYQIANRIHGTSMASLITRGDLNDNSPLITHKIYVRPIMKPREISQDAVNEFIPDDVLLVDKVHTAVRRLFEPRGGQVASTVRIINFSIGIDVRLFYNLVSPLAKLLDWLSFKYRVLFIISAGNNIEDMELERPFDIFAGYSLDDKDKIIIKSLEKRIRNQRLLSPAESMNSLTVGALFADNSNFTKNPRQIIPCSDLLPSPISAFGRGINHAIKPDLLMNGGRNVLMQNPIHPTIGHWRKGVSNSPPGILSAKPFTVSGGGNKVGYSFGTSNSAAILSHNAMHCYDTLNEIFQNETGQNVPPNYTALLLKAMLVHGAEWGETLDIICRALNLKNRNDFADNVHKWIGYGKPNIDKVKECTKNRITLIGFDELKHNAAHVFSLPLPFNFYTSKIFRKLTVTLAYFTPIVPTTKKYKAAQLWFTLDDTGEKLVGKRGNASYWSVARGTVQHEIFTNSATATWDEDASIEIKVNCREDAGPLIEPIPYALFVTFEIAPQYNIDVYARVIDRIRLREAITP
jgi:hypothetical protein